MAKRVLRYLAHTVNYGLVNDIGDGSKVRLTCFTDADYANDVDDRKMVSGYVTMIDDNVVSYASRKQAINAQSTTEAEYVAMNEGTKDLVWVLELCVELKWEVEGPVLFGDNRGSIFLSSKPGKTCLSTCTCTCELALEARLSRRPLLGSRPARRIYWFASATTTNQILSLQYTLVGSLCCRRTALSNLSSCPPARPFAQQFIC